MKLTPRRRAMLRYLEIHGPCPWRDVVRVERDLDGRFHMAGGDAISPGAERDLNLLRHAGLVHRMRIRLEGRDRYPFTITLEGRIALAAARETGGARQYGAIPVRRTPLSPRCLSRGPPMNCLHMVSRRHCLICNRVPPRSSSGATPEPMCAEWTCSCGVRVFRDYAKGEPGITPPVVRDVLTGRHHSCEPATGCTVWVHDGSAFCSRHKIMWHEGQSRPEGPCFANCEWRGHSIVETPPPPETPFG